MTKSMTEGNPIKLILVFSLPLIIGNMFQQFYSMADTLIVGRTIGVNALAAVGCTGTLSFFVLGFVMGFTSGLSIITAQKFGAQDAEGVKKSFGISIILSFALSVIMTVLACILTLPALNLLHTPEEILSDACSYLLIIYLGIPASVLFNFASNMIRELGDSKTPLCFLILACCINIILDYAFILIFGMGVAGAGIATVLAQLLSGICCFIFIRKKMPALWITREHLRLSMQEVVSSLKVALPMAFQMSIIAIGALVLQSALNGLGPVSVAAYAAAQKIDSIATMPLNSLGVAMSTYSAQNYGAGKIDRVRKGVFQCILISLCFSVVMAFVNIFAGSNLAGLFVGNAELEVRNLAKVFLSVNGSFYWILGLLFIYRFTLQGLGNSMIPTVAGAVELISRALGAVILVRFFHFRGVCMSNVLAWIGAGVLLMTAYYLYMRKLRKAVIFC